MLQLQMMRPLLIMVFVLASGRSTGPGLDDQGAERGASIIRLQYASAIDVASTLNQLTESAVRACSWRRGCALVRPGKWPDPPEPNCRVLADIRTNSLLVECAPEDLPHVRELVARLDR